MFHLNRQVNLKIKKHYIFLILLSDTEISDGTKKYLINNVNKGQLYIICYIFHMIYTKKLKLDEKDMDDIKEYSIPLKLLISIRTKNAKRKTLLNKFCGVVLYILEKYILKILKLF